MGQRTRVAVVNLEFLFPELKGTAFEVTSPTLQDYNCIAWAAGDDSRWWWPDPSGQCYWPEGVPRNITVTAFIEAFQGLGYEICSDSGLEQGVEKVAIFAYADGEPTHAARQLSDGTWTSKLGTLEDIRHISLDHVSGQQYGNPVYILQRRRTNPKPSLHNSDS